jgi:hypothetical protein
MPPVSDAFHDRHRRIERIAFPGTTSPARGAPGRQVSDPISYPGIDRVIDGTRMPFPVGSHRALDRMSPDLGNIANVEFVKRERSGT